MCFSPVDLSYVNLLFRPDTESRIGEMKCFGPVYSISKHEKNDNKTLLSQNGRRYLKSERTKR